jgi:hypothetical protein
MQTNPDPCWQISVYIDTLNYNILQKNWAYHTPLAGKAL